LFFLALPVVTNSAESKKLPDRIVEVVELTPEQQAKLPPSMTVGQMPMLPSVPAMPGGKLPLTSLFPGMNPNSGIKITPPGPTTNNSVDSWIDRVNRDAISYGSGASIYGGLGAPIGGTYPPPRPTPSEDEAAKKAADLKQAQIDLEKKDAEKKADEAKQADEAKKAEDAKKAEEAKRSTPAGPGVVVEPGQQPTGSTPLAPGTPTGNGTAADLKNPTPAQVAQQQQWIAATTYDGKGTTLAEQDTAQQALPGVLLAQLEPELNKLPEADRNAIVGKIAFSAVPTAQIELREFKPQVAPLPPGVEAFNFGNTQPPEQVEAIVQVYLRPDGKLLGKPTIVRSAGTSWLNDLAIQVVEKAITEKPEKLDYQAIRFKVPYILPKKANA
jgi:hypothetical protein